MDRRLFLEKCRKVSCLEDGILRIKKNVPKELRVKYNGIPYYPFSYELSFRNGTPIHEAVLHDLTANAIVRCDLEKVEEVEI